MSRILDSTKGVQMVVTGECGFRPIGQLSDRPVSAVQLHSECRFGHGNAASNLRYLLGPWLGECQT